MTDIFSTDKKYSVIYADPPWQYKVWGKKGHGRSAENHYPTMCIEDLCALPVDRLADKNCTLFMWVTFPVLPDVFRVLQEWGFTYKTVAFVWVKRNKKALGWFWGLGHWTRANAEICILATKGKPKRICAGVHQIIESPVEKHSKKPDETRERIETLVGALPRIELFARQRCPGWDCWGDDTNLQAESTVQVSVWEKAKAS